jgi:hypothetical protein
MHSMLKLRADVRTRGQQRLQAEQRDPYLVVLVIATPSDEGSNWVTLAPLLANNGYCVYSFNYGETGLSDFSAARPRSTS